ncbi:MAG: dihydroorotase [Bacteroidota bacterium]
MDILIKNASVVNEGKICIANILINNGLIEKISENEINEKAQHVIDAKGLHLFPGLIDDQVHFREPGLTHKGTIYSEAKAAVAGGITSFMEMPNTVPAALTQELLEDKYKIAEKNSLANYSFYIGTSNTNLEDILKTNPKNVCGVKIFMGSSTGNLVVDDKQALENVFKHVKLLIATHCEDDGMIKKNLETLKNKLGENIGAEMHPIIRNADGCYASSSFAVNLAKKHNTRLHILHISTEKELELFTNKIPLKEKRITAEACVHHLWFSDKDYATKGNFIKWNPAIKSETDRDAILKAVLNDTIDVIATDHAPHTIEEKNQSYLNAPSGGPLVQHSLLALIEMHKQGKISLEKIAQKTAHNVADMFSINKRGYIREGYYADLVLVDLNSKTTVTKENILSQCKWSPFEGTTFNSQIKTTIVSGKLVYHNGIFDESSRGMRLEFDR